MYKFCIAILLLFSLTACSQDSTTTQKNNHPMSFEINKSEEDWKQQLSPAQYYVLREKGTERPFTGEFNLNFDKGVYKCAACGNELFTSDMKFQSHCGWPSFDREIEGGKIKTITDTSHNMVRTEIICAKCGGHLGHIFDDGPTATGKRYCVNSLSLEFVKKE